MMAERFDLVVIGAGSAGFAAARTASRLGASVALIDRGPLGGLCILRGCMPSKALLRSAEIAHLAAAAPLWGVIAEGVRPDFAAVMARKDRLIADFADYRLREIQALPRTTLITGQARFVRPDCLQVAGRRIEAERFIVATGSKSLVPPIPGLAETGFILSDEALSLRELPGSLLIIGGGVIAVELGQFFARMGTAVTLLEAAPHLLPKEDVDVSRALEHALKAEGIEVVTGARVRRALVRAGRKVLVIETAEGPQALEAQEIFVATGRGPNLDGLQLDRAQVELEDRRIAIDATMQTSNPRIYAAGDTWGGSFLVHVAIAEGELAARNAVTGGKESMDYRVMPLAVFTDPNVARVGPTEHECSSQGREILTATYPFAELGRAELMGGTALWGFVKLLADARTGELLGAQAVGPEASELIHELAAAITLRATVSQFMQIPHVHPTLSEIWTYPAEELDRQLQARGMRARVTLMPGGYGLDEVEPCLESPAASPPE